MDTSTLSSTFVLTLLMMIGLFFFIRASVKDRTEQVTLNFQMPEDDLLTRLQTYFEKRAYQVAASEPQNKQVTLEGFVRPSRFLAIFLSFLAALGLLSLSLVLSLLYPPLTGLFLCLTFLAPLAGIFYWKRAARVEKISLKLEPTPGPGQSRITITAHRDELIQLQQTAVTLLK
ncbi:cofactor assembly of complex C subunit B [Gloeothece verrucosa]|uniref:Cofactor assembly of complex C subunit B n=1 Tax=Gloeothece verrucosa (strain PCC 7822) TaxID=497965 RepID=E0UK31_GLOV7|nr:cofactor assembly of complex C subunit B [Gloeothece verrucosa]ADN14667.1 conserved hypothetical protein [Gloeothece verrucosa PCC 7822]